MIAFPAQSRKVLPTDGCRWTSSRRLFRSQNSIWSRDCRDTRVMPVCERSFSNRARMNRLTCDRLIREVDLLRVSLTVHLRPGFQVRHQLAKDLHGVGPTDLFLGITTPGVAVPVHPAEQIGQDISDLCLGEPVNLGNARQGWNLIVRRRPALHVRWTPASVGEGAALPLPLEAGRVDAVDVLVMDGHTDAV